MTGVTPVRSHTAAVAKCDSARRRPKAPASHAPARNVQKRPRETQDSFVRRDAPAPKVKTPDQRFLDGGDWGEPISESDGVTIYKRDIEGFPFPEYRVDTIIDAPLPTVVAMMTDADCCTHWGGTKETAQVGSTTRDTQGNAVYVWYTLSANPIGGDRIAFSQITRFLHPQHGQVELQSYSIEDDGTVLPNVTRVTKAQNTTLITACSPTQTRIQYRLAVDPNITGASWAGYFFGRAIDNFTCSNAQKAMETFRACLNNSEFTPLKKALATTDVDWKTFRFC